MSPLTFLLFFALIPLFRLESLLAERPQLRRPGWYFFGCVYLAMLIFNVATTWWVSNSTLTGGIFANLANAALMSVPWLLFRLTRRSVNARFGYWSLFFYYIGFEYLHLNWDISWPWLTLGNGFALFPEWVQWYEYTGVLGGTLWLLLVNLMGYFALVRHLQPNLLATRLSMDLSLMGFILIPIIASYYRYFHYEDRGTPVEVVAIQPNIDPYTEKFIGSENHIPVAEQIARFIELSESALTPQTRLVLWPETAIDGAIEEASIESYEEIQLIRDFVNRHPDVTLLTGLTTFRRYADESQATPTARYRPGVGYYDLFNTAALVRAGAPLQLYHKSRLVPGVEIMPYPHLFKFLDALVIDLGGSSGSLGRQKERTVFRMPPPDASFGDSLLGIVPTICYESIYGGFITRYLRQEAHLLTIITNDGWWGHTAGHRQHLQYATLRAVEVRRSVARSANTGISAFINQRGDLLQPTRYWEQDVIRGEVRVTAWLTVYAQYGDYLGRIFGYTAPFFLLSVLVRRRVAPKIRRKATQHKPV